MEDDNPECSVGELVCPLTHRLFEFPVTTTDGFTYNAQEIREWLSNHSASPMTRDPLSKTTLFASRSIAYLCSAYTFYHSRLAASKQPPSHVLTIEPTTAEEQTLARSREFCEAFDQYRDATESKQNLIQKMQRVLEKFPDNIECLLTYYNMLRYYKEYARAEEIRGRVVALAPNCVDARLLEARLLLEKGEKSRGYEALDQINVETENLTLRSTLRLAVTLFSMERERMGLRLVQAYLAADPDSKVARAELIKMRCQLNEDPEAVRLGEAYLAEHPGDFTAAYYTSLSHVALGNRVRAVELLETIKREKRDEEGLAWANYRIASLRDEEKEFDTVASELKKAHELCPEIGADLSLSKLYLRGKKFKEAAEMLKKVQSGEEEIMELRAYAFEHAGMQELAVGAYIALAESFPGYKDFCSQRIDLMLSAAHS